MKKEKQFKGFTIKGFSDVYSIDIAGSTEDLAEKIHQFFSQRKAKRIEDKMERVYQRGQKIWNWLSLWSEFWLYHIIEINITDNKVTLTYNVPHGMFFRTPPCHFEKEVIQLEHAIT